MPASIVKTVGGLVRNLVIPLEAYIDVCILFLIIGRLQFGETELLHG